MRIHALGTAVVLLLAAAAPARAQEEGGDRGPAFSVASSQIFTTRDSPFIHLRFRQVTQLDFRVYRVADPMRFFAGLRDPHQLGSPEPVVPEERTWIERIANWKAARRSEIRTFVRRQVSPEYRARRRERLDTQEVQLRRTVAQTSFAQVPLLNASQLVTSWRELLPGVRDAEARRIPLELPGPGVYLVEAVHAPLKAYTIVMISDVGLLTKAAPGQLLTYAADRFTGDPVAGCEIQTLANQQRVAEGVTDPDGVVVTALEPDTRPDVVVAVAKCGDQVAATDPGSWHFQAAARDLVGYLYTDKPIYRPGHTVRIKAILRWRAQGALVPFDRRQAEIVIADPNDKVVFRQTRDVDRFGSVLATFPVPGGASLGYYSIRLNTEDDTAYGSFEVQEYRKPEFEVTVTPAARFAVQGGEGRATIAAKYYFGQPVAGGTVTYAIYRTPYYSPFRWTDAAEDDGFEWYGEGDQVSQADARLDDNGTVQIPVPLPVDRAGRDYTYRVEARVTDASSREVSGRGSLTATYGPFLLGAGTDRYVYQPGARAELRLRAVDYAGTPQPAVAVNVSLERLTYPAGRYDDPAVTTIAESTVRTDPEGRATWQATVGTEPGDYRFRASAPAGSRLVRAETRLWVPGRTRDFTEDRRFLELILDRPSYAPGDTARVMVRGEEFQSAVLITKESQLVSYHRVARVRANEAIEVPITEDDVGDTFVAIAFLKDDRLYTAERRVSVPAVSRQVTVTIEADRDVARPAQPGVLTVKTADPAGRPVPAQVSLAVVDEAVYGVKPDATPDALRFFYRREYTRVGTQFSRNYSFAGYSGVEQLQLAQRRRPFTLADFKGDAPPRPQVRREFPDAIYWIGDLVTDAQGLATVRITYPDALTTWRITARAVTEDTRVGATMARTLTTKDLILRVVTPRFLTEGDEAALPAIVHNYLPDEQAIAVSLETTGLTPADSERPLRDRVTVAAGGEQRIDWSFRADRAGTATVKGTAAAAADGDALELSLPVLPYGLRREAGRSGSIAGAAEQTVDLTIPDASNPSARTIEVALAPSLAGSLLGALDFLTSYPYGCTEQILSSFVPNLVVSRTLEQLRIPPTARLRGLDRQISEGLRRLYEYQHPDGGWGWWRTDRNHPFMTAYALHGLLEVQAAGYRVDEWRVGNGASALFALYREYPRAVPDLKAYMGYVLARTAGRNVVPRRAPDGTAFDGNALREELWSRRTDMTPYGRALLVMALDAAGDPRGAELARALLGEARASGELAWWESGDDPLLGDFVNVDVEATAMAVKAIVPHEPESAVLERAIRWLMLNRNAGVYWSSTKQTAMVLYGVVDYLAARGETPDDYSVEVHVNGRVAGTRTFTRADWTNPNPVAIAAEGRTGANQVRIVKRGPGTVYWSAVARYFYNGPALEPAGSRRLALTREYFSLSPVQQRDRIVYRESPFDGRARPGDLLLVRLTAAGSSDWRYLMIEDPLPAGAEAIQQRGLYQLEKPDTAWDPSRREYRDDRVALFQEDFTRGRYGFTYLLKVVTPGRFRAMPARIAPMYVPDVAASTGDQILVVESAAVPPVAGPVAPVAAGARETQAAPGAAR